MAPAGREVARVLDQLLAPGSIGTLRLRNRIVMSPMGSNLAEPDGHVGDRLQRYYEARARGGAGLLIVGVGAIAFPDGACNPNQVAISDDAFLPGLRALTQRVHAHGAKIAIQLQHAGAVAVCDMERGTPLLVPSPVKPKVGDLTRDLTADELAAFTAGLRKPTAKIVHHVMDAADIHGLVARFADAADRARRAGFDGVEVHAGHGYLIGSFLSPATNHRDDEYGGPVENRARLLGEVIGAIKQRVGADYPVWCRLDGKEFRTPGGITEPDAAHTAALAEAAGADAVHVSAYADSSSGIAFTDAPLVHTPGGFVALAAAVKARVAVPVIAVGRIEPQQADALIGSGGADFVAMARKLLADPELPTKLAQDREGDVRPCIYCYTCVGEIFLRRASCCAVNPASGREAEFEPGPATGPRRIVVVGGGPAGMEAARRLALRGHAVSLHERSAALGGAARFAALTNPDTGRLLDWLEAQVRAADVALHLGEAMTPERVRALAPDAVVVATGARSDAPLIPGGDGPRVLDRTALYAQLRDGGGAAIEALGPRVAVLGGGAMGLAIAAHLLAGGLEITVVERAATLGAEMAPPRRWRALHTLRDGGARLLTGHRAIAIDETGVQVEDADGQRLALAADRVVWVGGTRPERALADSLHGSGAAVYAIGDCGAAGLIRGALADAARLARDL